MVGVKSPLKPEDMERLKALTRTLEEINKRSK